MSSPDPISLVALIVSLIALILTTVLAVAQQYIATASDYRHCSQRTLGGWHKRSRRQFIWSELRFEVHFAVPVIRVSIPEPSDRGGTQYILHTRKGDRTFTSFEYPWFLDSKGTLNEAKCTWLSVLNDAATAYLQIGIKELKLSYDFMPQGIRRPLAQMDQRSFLTLMSLFQVSWQEGWSRGKAESGSTPTGAGPYCEVTSRHLANLGGPVISYQPSESNVIATRRFHIASENARSAMFSRFDLGFHVVLTHTAEEVYRSALELADESAAQTVQACYGGSGWSPGLAEVIGCFAEPQMPKAISVEHGTDDFVSIFSARSIGCTFNDFPLAQLLVGEEIRNSTPSCVTFTRWTMDYISSLEGEVAGQLRAALGFACTYFGAEAHQREPISWSESRRSLHVIKLLDTKLSSLCQSLAPDQSVLSVHREFAQLQIRFLCTLLGDTSALAQQSGGFWRDFIGAIVAEKYVEMCSSLGERYPQSDEAARRRYVINRLMRGVLWHIHNGNHPFDGTHASVERQLECSLNNLWLSDSSTLWID